MSEEVQKEERTEMEESPFDNPPPTRKWFGGLLDKVLPMRWIESRGFGPERAKDYLEYARQHRNTLRNEVVAVGPNFDRGMNHLDEYERTVKQYDDKWLTDDLYDKWTNSFIAMYSDGFGDVVHAVNSSKPATVSEERLQFDRRQPEDRKETTLTD